MIHRIPLPVSRWTFVDRLPLPLSVSCWTFVDRFPLPAAIATFSRCTLIHRLDLVDRLHLPMSRATLVVDRPFQPDTATCHADACLPLPLSRCDRGTFVDRLPLPLPRCQRWTFVNRIPLTLSRCSPWTSSIVSLSFFATCHASTFVDRVATVTCHAGRLSIASCCRHAIVRLSPLDVCRPPFAIDVLTAGR